MRVIKICLFAVTMTVTAIFSWSVSAATVDEFNAAFADANETRKMANSLGYEWRDTAKILKQAAEAAQQGDLDKAMELVAQAKFQGETAISQANREKDLWVGRVIR